MVTHKSSRVNREYKTKYRVRNWREYERGLKNRGDVTIWLSEATIAAWIPPKNGLRASIWARRSGRVEAFATDIGVGD